MLAVPRSLALPRQKLVLLLTLSLGHVLMHCFQHGWYIVMPSVKMSLNLTDVQYGGIESTRSLTGVVANPAAGAMSDMLRKHWVIILTSGLMGVAFAYFILGLAPSYPVVLMAAALIGISISLWHPPALSTLSAQLRDRLGFALSMHGMGGEIGNTIGPLGLGILIGAMAWQMAAQIMAIPIVFLALILWLVLRNIPGRQGGSLGGRQYLVAVRELAGNRLALGIVLSRGVLTLGTGGILTFFSLYLQRDLGFDAAIAGIYYAILMGSGIVSQPIMGSLSDRRGRKAVIVPSVVLLGLFMMALRWATSGIWLLLVSIGIGLFIYSIGAILQAAAVEVTDERTGALIISMLFFSSSLFGIPAPMIAGAISGAYGTTAVFLYSGIMIVFAGLFFWWRLPSRPVQASPPPQH